MKEERLSFATHAKTLWTGQALSASCRPKKTLRKNLKKTRAGRGDNNADTTEEEQLFDLV